MPKNLKHNDLFYRKPPPTYQSGRSKQYHPRPKRREQVSIFRVGLVLVVLVAAIVVVYNFQKPKTAPETEGDMAVSQVQTPAPEGEETGSEMVSEPAMDMESRITAGGGAASEIAETADSDEDSLTPAKERDISEAEFSLFNTMMIVDGVGYRYYDFVESGAIAFVDMLEDAQERLGDQVNFYSMVVPDAADVMLPQDFLRQVDTSDQQKALDYLTGSIQSVVPKMHPIDPYDILKANCDKDLYFKTDANWTALGAYYGYRAFAKEAGLTALPLTDFTESTVEGFCGELYPKSNYNELLNYTEPVTVYTPPGEIFVSYFEYGEKMETALIGNADNYGTEEKYSVFLTGNYAYMEIENRGITDGSALVLVKDSLGNPMVPFLTQHYQYIYVVDYRHWSENMSTLMSHVSSDNVLLVCRMTAATESYEVSLLEEVFS